MSAYSDDYRELLEIHRKLDAIMWHIGIRTDRQRQQEQERRVEQAERIRREQAEIRERRDRGWRRMPREQRESVLLQVLGDEGLTLGELAARLEAELGVHIYDNDVRYPVKLMLGAGLLERDAEVQGQDPVPLLPQAWSRRPDRRP